MTKRAGRSWTGKVVVGIGIIHTLFGVAMGWSIFGELLAEGLFNTVTEQFDRNAVFWFMFSGFLLMILGAFLNWSERVVGQVPPFMGWSLLALTLFGVVIMPQSGLWLILIPAVGLLRSSKTQQPT